MAKNNRGKSLYKLPSRSRGTCPVCLATRIKLLNKVKKSDGTALQVCKRCVSATQIRIDSAHQNPPAAFRRKHKRTFYKQNTQHVG